MDETLLPYDSMRKFYALWWQRTSCFLPLTMLAIQRKLHLKNRKHFVEKFLKEAGAQPDFEKVSREFGKTLIRDLSGAVIKKVEAQTDTATINVLCTSSPECYSCMISEHLGWALVGSKFENGTFIHNYGERKAENILKKFPKEAHHYNFSISNSESDLPLLNLFSRFELRI
ncbi:MAG TPA: HAD family hydrolase [Chitinophagales bacterium]|nr:HAD family hydrolase [Chitinophagales bacterium]